MIDRGDIIWVILKDAEGHGMQGIHPALVISPKIYNEASGKTIICWITSKVHGYPFEVVIPEDLKVHGVILADNINTIDWLTRKAKVIERLPDEMLAEVMEKVGLLIS
jgi:mRNA interferase MazF